MHRDEQRKTKRECREKGEAERPHASLLVDRRRPKRRLRYLLASARVKGRVSALTRAASVLTGKCGISRVMTTVGMVGLGLLGHALASRLRAAGHAVIGHDVLSERRDALVALGGVAVPTPVEVAKGGEAVCIVLPSLAAVEEVITALDTATVVIQMSTISPGLTARLARLTEARGQAFLDCPVSGTAGMVAGGEGVIFAGGERVVYERWRPILEAMLPRVVYVGRAGQAMTLKLVANLLVGVHSAAAAEDLAMARQSGLDMSITFDVLTSGAAGSRMLEVRGPMMIRDEFPPQMKLDLFMKDLHLIQAAAREVGAATPLTDVAERLYAAVHARGHGGQDLATVVKALDP
jgi:3-hydroxyisobutyrate dehydrogenase-like beta-hydroxyacid dehydrogenase